MKSYKDLVEGKDLKSLYKVLGSLDKSSWNSFMADISLEIQNAEKVTIPTSNLSKIMKKVIQNVH